LVVDPLSEQCADAFAEALRRIAINIKPTIVVRAARGRNPAHLLPLPIAENFPRFHLEKCMFASLTFERVGADFLMQPD
jgi:hypothetical protein